MEITKFVPDNSKLTLLLIQLKQAIKSKNYLLYITHTRSHTGFPGPLTKKKLLILKIMLKASNFHEKHINKIVLKGLKFFPSFDNKPKNNNKNVLHVLYTTKLYYLLIITPGGTKK